MDDREIISLFWERDELAVAETQKSYGKFCNSIADRILNNRQDAEECVNDAYLALWNTIPPERPQHLSAYLGRIVRNISLKKYRARTAKKRSSAVMLTLDELAECIPDPNTPDAEMRNRELSGMLDAFLRSLPEVECSVFLRRYWYFDSIEDICKRFGFGKSKVKMMLHRTREKLRKKLKEEDFTI